MSELTWRCHICKRERADRLISVRKHDRMMGNVPFQENIRYCNDRLFCIARSLHFTLLKGVQ